MPSHIGLNAVWIFVLTLLMEGDLWHWANGCRFPCSVVGKKENSSDSTLCSTRDSSSQMKILEDPIRKWNSEIILVLVWGIYGLANCTGFLLTFLQDAHNSGTLICSGNSRRYLCKPHMCLAQFGVLCIYRFCFSSAAFMVSEDRPPPRAPRPPPRIVSLHLLIALTSQRVEGYRASQWLGCELNPSKFGIWASEDLALFFVSVTLSLYQDHELL